MDNRASKDAALILQFLEFLKLNLGRTDGTVDGYLLQLNRFSEYLSNMDKSLLNASVGEIEEFAGLHLHRLGIAPRSRRIAIAALRGFYKWAKKKGLTSVNTAVNLSYPRIGRKIPSFMPLQALESLLIQADLDKLSGVRDAAIISVLAGCGLRISGLIGLNESDLVADTQGGRDGIFFRVTEKGSNERLVPVPGETLLMVRAYLGHPDLRRIERTLPNGDKPLFVNIRNPLKKSCDHFGESRRLSATGVRRMLKKYGRLAGVPLEFCHPHALRHLYGTSLIENDVDLITAGQLMGHTSTESTKLYIHLATRRLRDAVDKGNPLSKINTPVSGLTHLLDR